MIGADERVRVMDFGLVAAFHGALAIGADALAAQAAAAVADYEGMRKAQPDRTAAQQWIAIAETLLTRLGVGTGRRSAPLAARWRSRSATSAPTTSNSS